MRQISVCLCLILSMGCASSIPSATIMNSSANQLSLLASIQAKIEQCRLRSAWNQSAYLQSTQNQKLARFLIIAAANINSPSTLGSAKPEKLVYPMPIDRKEMWPDEREHLANVQDRFWTIGCAENNDSEPQLARRELFRQSARKVLDSVPDSILRRDFGLSHLAFVFGKKTHLDLDLLQRHRAWQGSPAWLAMAATINGHTQDSVLAANSKDFGLAEIADGIKFKPLVVAKKLEFQKSSIRIMRLSDLLHETANRKEQ